MVKGKTFRPILLGNFWRQSLDIRYVAIASGPTPRLMNSHFYHTYFLFTD